MSIYIEGPEFGHYEVTIRQISREALIQLVNCLTETESSFIDSLRREIESELMELTPEAWIKWSTTFALSFVMELLKSSKPKVTSNLSTVSNWTIRSLIKSFLVSGKKSPQLLFILNNKAMNRHELLDAYIDRILDNMSTKDLIRIVGDQIEENLSGYSDEELIAEVEEYYPELIEEWFAIRK